MWCAEDENYDCAFKKDEYQIKLECVSKVNYAFKEK